jgi:pilus assembly protein Flp/PilA
MQFLVTLMNRIALREHHEDRCATVVEYALLVALIALVVIGAITIFGSSLADFFGGLGDQLPDAPTTT